MFHLDSGSFSQHLKCSENTLPGLFQGMHLTEIASKVKGDAQVEWNPPRKGITRPLTLESCQPPEGGFKVQKKNLTKRENAWQWWQMPQKSTKISGSSF